MWRNIASNALTLFIVVLVVASGLLTWLREDYVRPGPLTQAICFKVERGATISVVSAGLAQQGAVRQAAIFRLGTEYSGRGDALKFGSYLILPQASMEDIVGDLTTGGASTCGEEVNFRIGVAAAAVVLRRLDPASNKYIEVVKFDPAKDEVPADYAEAVEGGDLRYQVTVAEGVTSWMVVEALKTAGFLEGEIKAVPAEGSLQPGGYEVDKGGDRQALLDQMTAGQAATLAELWAGRDEDLPYATPEEAMVMASIVEKETGVAAERAQVASVFLNRIAAGMKLQTDPTVIYGVTKGHGVLGRGLRQSELRRATPWNTYVIDGLPETPIANPGRAAIEAALHPADTDYLYFVADGSGGHAFAEDLAQHNINVAKWRAIEAEQGTVDNTGTGDGG